MKQIKRKKRAKIKTLGKWNEKKMKSVQNNSERQKVSFKIYFILVSSTFKSSVVVHLKRRNRMTEQKKILRNEVKMEHEAFTNFH